VPLTQKLMRRLPKIKDVALLMRALTANLPLSDVQHGLRTSMRGVINYRIAGESNDRRWSVDVYSRRYFVVTTRGFTVVRPSVLSAVNHLKRML
jgi:hypothetical protein